MKDKLPYIIIGVLIGVIIMQWQQGPQPAQAQAPEVITGYRVVSGSVLTDHFAMLSNGDVYRQSHNSTYGATFNTPPTKVGNFWTGQGGAVPTEQKTWGGVKGKLGDG